MRLTHIRLLADDFAGTFRFYRDVMGMTVKWGDETSTYADFADSRGASVLALFDRAEMLDAVGSRAGIGGERVVLVFQVSDVDRELARLRERGALVAAGPTDHPDWGLRTAHVRDPEGNLVEIYQDLPKDAWDPALRQAAEARYGDDVTSTVGELW